MLRTRGDWTLAGAVITLALSGAACDPPGTFVVGTTSDSGDDSLRAAIAWANASSERNARIELPRGEYELTSCGPDDTNARGDLDLTTERFVTIVATAPGVVIRQNCSGERVLHGLGSGLLTLSRVQLSGGSVVSSDPAKPAQGGGLRARGSVRLEEVTIAENSVTGAPGQSAPAGQGPITGGLAQGGGVFVEGSLYAASTTFSSNTARGGAGTDAPSNDGVASGGGAAEGGAAYVAGIVSIEAGMLTENRVEGGDGGRGPANPGGGGAARGGAVAQSAAVTLPVTLANVTLSANSALGGASGNGTGPSFPPESVPAAGAASGGALACAGPFNATAIEASQNTARGGSSGLGGCPADTQCLSSAEPGAARGGAIAAGRATVRDGNFGANRAASGNVGCSGRNCSAFGAPAEGGGVWSASELSLTDVAFTDNDASQGTGVAPSYGAGGALGGGAASAGALAVEGATFSGNAATNGRGGALSGSSVTVRAATFTNNEADGGGGAIQASELDASGVTASRNIAGGSGGGAMGVSGDALVSQCRILDNSVDSQAGPARGGGLLVTGSLARRDTEVSGNRGRSTVTLGTFGTFPSVFAGGGVSAGNLSAERVTIANNEVFSIAVAHPALPGGPSGGGGVHASGVSLVNVTVSDNLINEAPPTYGNETVAPNRGAAVLGQSITLEHVTIADNRGAASLRASQLTSRRSVLVAASGRSACEAGVTVLAATYNHFSDASCALNGTGNQQTDAPFLLGPVADNGGAVPTRLPAYASVLVDAVPPAACPVTEDARGVARPRGVGCDIGAVELQPLSGTGSADLSVAFTVPPLSVTPGDAATWQLTVQNKGPNAAAPAVRIAVPDGITLTSASATEGGACTLSSPAECVFGRALPPGGTAHITLVAQIDMGASVPLTWSAEVFARDLRPPFDDDLAELTTPLAPRSGIRMTAGFTRFSDTPGHEYRGVALQLFNDGPSSAVGTPGAPIQVVFHPTSGVQALQTPEPIIGSFAPSDVAFATFFVGFLVDGTVPAQLGTFELIGGASAQPPVPPLPVYAADLEVRAYRAPGGEPSGAPVDYRIEVQNRGPAAATDVVVSLESSAQNEWVPSLGSVENGSSWNIVSLAPGQTATLTGSAAVGSERAFTSASVAARTVDLNPENEAVELLLDPAPQGTADLQVTSLQAYPGAGETQRVLRATVTNTGPAASLPGEHQGIYLFVTQLVDARLTAVRSLSPGWTCSVELPSGCATMEPVAVGAALSFEIVLEGTFPDSFPRPGVWLMPAVTPDPDPNNNRRYVDAALGL